MKVAIHQPNYLPGLNGLGSFWSKARQADIFILLDTVQFSDNYFMHRALLPNGQVIGNGPNKTSWLTVPCKHPRLGLPIKDVLIDWQHYKPLRQCKSLESKSKLSKPRVQPFLDALRYGSDMVNFERIIHWRRVNGVSHRLSSNPYQKLVDWNELLIKKLALDLHVGCQWRRASNIRIAAEPLEANERLALLVQAVKGDTYILPYIPPTAKPAKLAYIAATKKMMSEHGIELEEMGKQ